MKYSIIYNKAISGLIYPVAMVNIGPAVVDMYADYNLSVRDKYDPYMFIEWMTNVHNIKSYKPGSKLFKTHYDVAYRFNFHAPASARKIKIRKKVKNVTTKYNKTIR